jgi:hypothetical protein
MSESERPRLGRPVEVIRAEIIAAPESKALAQTFGVSVEEYAELVLDYLQNPAKEPVLEVIDEDDAEEQGVALTTPGEVKAWLEDAATGRPDLATPPAQDGFSTDAAESHARAVLGSAAPATTAPKTTDPKAEILAPPSPLGSVLRAQVHAQRAQANLAAGRSTKPHK